MTSAGKVPRPEPQPVEELLREWFPDASYVELEDMAAKMRWAARVEAGCECCW